MSDKEVGIELESVKQDEDRLPKQVLSSPRILLIDVAGEEAIRDAGFNVISGTFGSPYSTTTTNNEFSVVFSDQLPKGTGEREIVVINLLKSPEFIKGQTVQAHHISRYSNYVDKTQKWVASQQMGFIDPRPAVMDYFQSTFDRTLNQGGVFIIFAA